jgi:hypothetical protein
MRLHMGGALCAACQAHGPEGSQSSGMSRALGSDTRCTEAPYNRVGVVSAFRMPAQTLPVCKTCHCLHVTLLEVALCKRQALLSSLHLFLFLFHLR